MTDEALVPNGARPLKLRVLPTAVAQLSWNRVFNPRSGLPTNRGCGLRPASSSTPDSICRLDMKRS